MTKRRQIKLGFRFRQDERRGARQSPQSASYKRLCDRSRHVSQRRKPWMDYQDNVVVVSGGATDFGKAMAVRFAEISLRLFPVAAVMNAGQRTIDDRVLRLDGLCAALPPGRATAALGAGRTSVLQASRRSAHRRRCGPWQGSRPPRSSRAGSAQEYGASYLARPSRAPAHFARRRRGSPASARLVLECSSRHACALVTRADTPSLLKDLPFGPDDVAFSSPHTPKAGRLYLYHRAGSTACGFGLRRINPGRGDERHAA